MFSIFFSAFNWFGKQIQNKYMTYSHIIILISEDTISLKENELSEIEALSLTFTLLMKQVWNYHSSTLNISILSKFTMWLSSNMENQTDKSPLFRATMMEKEHQKKGWLRGQCFLSFVATNSVVGWQWWLRKGMISCGQKWRYPANKQTQINSVSGPSNPPDVLDSGLSNCADQFECTAGELPSFQFGGHLVYFFL